MSLEKAFEREALRSVLTVCGMGRQLLEGVKAFYRGANACVKENGEFGDSF